MSGQQMKKLLESLSAIDESDLVSYEQKKDKDPRHPENKGVGANKGFVGEESCEDTEKNEELVDEGIFSFLSNKKSNAVTNQDLNKAIDMAIALWRSENIGYRDAVKRVEKIYARKGIEFNDQQLAKIANGLSESREKGLAEEIRNLNSVLKHVDETIEAPAKFAFLKKLSESKN